jgi:hypothetical protein
MPSCYRTGMTKTMQCFLYTPDYLMVGRSLSPRSGARVAEAVPAAQVRHWLNTDARVRKSSST